MRLKDARIKQFLNMQAAEFGSSLRGIARQSERTGCSPTERAMLRSVLKEALAQANQQQRAAYEKSGKLVMK